MTVEKQLIDKVEGIRTTINEISVYNLDVKTSLELYYELAKKVNEVITELSRFEGVVSEEVVKQNEKLLYLLGEGLKEQVGLKIDELITNGTIQDLINNKIFNDLNTKIDNFKQEVDEQFNTIANKTIYVTNDVEDLGTVINNYIKTYNKIVLLGDYTIKTPVIFNEKDKLTITGNATIKIANSVDTLLSFINCKNINIENIEFDGNNNEIYKVISFYKCENHSADNIEIRNIKNLDVTKETYNIYNLSKNFKFNNIRFKNIKVRALKENETTGKGALTNLYVSISENFRQGTISNVYCSNSTNIDSNDVDIVVDADVIKFQYFEDGINSTPYNSLCKVSNCYGENFGKRMVKVQTAGVEIDGVEGETNNSLAFAIIDIHNEDVNINNVKFKTSLDTKTQCFIATGLKAKNVKFSNLEFDGKCDLGVIQIGNSSMLEYSDNVTIDGFKCSAIAREFITFQQATKNIKFNNLDVEGTFTTEIFRVMSFTLTDFLEYELLNSKINATCSSFNHFNQSKDYAKINIINSNINLTIAKYSGYDLVFSIIVTSGDVRLEKTTFTSKGCTYKWGQYIVDGVDSLYIDDLTINISDISDSTYEATRFNAKHLVANNLRTQNKINKILSHDCTINKCESSMIKLEKQTGVAEQHKISITGYTDELYMNNSTDYNVLNSDIFVLNGNCTLASGICNTTLALPYRMTKIKVLNAYTTESNVRCKALKKSTTAYDKVDIECVADDKSLNKTIDVTVIYQR